MIYHEFPFSIDLRAHVQQSDGLNSDNRNQRKTSAVVDFASGQHSHCRGGKAAGNAQVQCRAHDRSQGQAGQPAVPDPELQFMGGVANLY
jgi:hypothetical protein